MKKHYLFLCLPLLFSASCKKENTDPADKLPPATMTGANTFGCLVNGEVWLPHTGSIWDLSLDVNHGQWPTGEWQLKIGAYRKYPDKKIYQTFALNVWDPVLGENHITYNSRIFTDFEGCGFYRLDTLSPNVLVISKLDQINFIASGTFYFTVINDECQDTLRVTEGRFDADSHL